MQADQDENDIASAERREEGISPREHRRSSSEFLASATTKNALKPLIKEILPAAQPGLFPNEVSDELIRRHPDRLGGQDEASVQGKVRVALPQMHRLGEVARERATGPGGGKSFRWTLPKSGTEEREPGSERLPEQDKQAPSRASPPVIPTPVNTTISTRRSAQEDPPATSTGKYMRQQERSDGEGRDPHVERDNQVGRQSSQGLSSKTDGHGLLRQRNVDAQAERQYADSPDVIMELGRKVRRIHMLRTQLTESKRDCAEQRAQQDRDRERCTALERQAERNKATAGELEGEAQRLQEQLLLVRRRAAEHESEAHRLGAEASEKREECAQREVTVAKSEANCSDLYKELSVLKEALDVDWIIP